METISLKILLCIVPLCAYTKAAMYFYNHSHVLIQNRFTDFDELTDDSLYVDKTMLIEKFLDKANQAPFQLFTLPPKFGKTTNLKMMRSFFELSAFPDCSIVWNKTLTDAYKTFTNPKKNFKIARFLEPGGLYFDRFFNQLIVIPISFKIENGDNFENIMNGIRESIKKCYGTFQWVYEYLRNKPPSKNNETANAIKEQTNFIGRVFNDLTPLNETEIGRSLFVLAKYLFHVFNFRSIFVLIDDYDDPINKVIENNVQQFSKIHHLIDTIFTSLFDTRNRYVKYAFITGTTFALNKGKFINILHSRFLENNDYISYFGFNEQEVEELFERGNVERSERNALKQFYGTYATINNTVHIYNPLSIVTIVKDKKQDSDAVVDNFWANSCPIPRFFHGHKQRTASRYLVAGLIETRTVTFTLKKSFTIGDLIELRNQAHKEIDIRKFQADTFWSYLFHFGYLSNTNEENYYRTPNIEVEAFLIRVFSEY